MFNVFFSNVFFFLFFPASIPCGAVRCLRYCPLAACLPNFLPIFSFLSLCFYLPSFLLFCLPIFLHFNSFLTAFIPSFISNFLLNSYLFAFLDFYLPFCFLSTFFLLRLSAFLPSFPPSFLDAFFLFLHKFLRSFFSCLPFLISANLHPSCLRLLVSTFAAFLPSVPCFDHTAHRGRLELFSFRVLCKDEIPIPPQ